MRRRRPNLPNHIRPWSAPLSLALVGFLMLLSGAEVAAATEHVVVLSREFVVSSTGDDANPGTPEAPFRTISAAAQRAQAGDLVRIRAGTYSEDVRVAKEGTPERPIVFEAETPGTVVITGDNAGFAPAHWAGDDDILTQSANRWVTLHGLVFRGIGERPAVRASTGWHIVDCLFEEVSIGVNVRGHNVTISRSTFQDIDSPVAHAIVAFGGRNLTLTDLVIRRVNQRRLIEEIPHSAVLKILSVDGLLIERVVSEENVGPGLWLDTNNKNFVIRNNLLSGNTGDQADWEGPGLWIENNASANGMIYDNVVIDNTGAGIEVMESSGLTLRDNTLLRNAACIGFRNLDRGPDNDGLHDIHIHGNLCGDWSNAGIATGIGEWQGWDAASRRIAIDGNRFLAVPGTPVFDWLGEKAMTLQEVVTKFGFERNGAAY